VTDRHSDRHPSAERVQALLEGELPKEERALVEEHLHLCTTCSTEVEAWRTLFMQLEDLPVLRPAEGFADRVIRGVSPVGSRSLAARAKATLSAMSSPVEGRHPGDARIQDFVEGLLPGRQAARVRTHLDVCAGCAGEAVAWRSVLDRLQTLDRLSPSEGFSQSVMSEIRIPTPAPVVSKVPEWRRALRWARRLVPQTRQAWATLSGVAVTPAVTLGLLLWSLFTHPTLTPSALASFAWWKLSDLAAAAWQAGASKAMESAGLFEVYSFLGSVQLSPMSILGGFLMLSVGTVAAAWILYRNLIATHPVDGRYAYVPIS
jgi:anti-sigma factor RsiW